MVQNRRYSHSIFRKPIEFDRFKVVKSDHFPDLTKMVCNIVFKPANCKAVVRKSRTTEFDTHCVANCEILVVVRKDRTTTTCRKFRQVANVLINLLMPKLLPNLQQLHQ